MVEALGREIVELQARGPAPRRVRHPGWHADRGGDRPRADARAPRGTPHGDVAARRPAGEPRGAPLPEPLLRSALHAGPRGRAGRHRRLGAASAAARTDGSHFVECARAVRRRRRARGASGAHAPWGAKIRSLMAMPTTMMDQSREHLREVARLRPSSRIGPDRRWPRRTDDQLRGHERSPGERPCLLPAPAT